MTKESRQRALKHQLARLDHRLTALKQVSHRYTWLRLIVFFSGLIISSAGWYLAGLQMFGGLLLLTMLAFSGAVYYHRRLQTAVTRHQIWQQLKQVQLARTRLEWAKIPGFTRFQPRYDHPFEADMDLVGEASLHHLLDVAISREGSALLREWLTDPLPKLDNIRRRQALVTELIPLSLFRHKLALNAILASGTRKMWDAHRLTTWLANYRPERSLRGWLWVSGGLIGLNVTLLALNLAGVIAPLWQATLLGYFILLWFLNSNLLGSTFKEATNLQAALQQLNAVFAYLEQFSFRGTPRLQQLCAPFSSGTHRPSAQLTGLTRVVTAAGLREHPIMWLLLNALFPWDLVVAHQLARRKTVLAEQAPTWMAIWFELEALSSLANLAYLNPDRSSMPRLEPPADAPIFEAQAIGHPLIPDHERITNNFAIQELGDIAIITGSNMAGKSTFLRTVGLNMALAFAGGPVLATQLSTALFRLFSCIKVTDSVTNGISYFYAEVKRLKLLLDGLQAEAQPPLFYFIDEIFRGTNNRERFIGSQSYIYGLLAQRGVGLISTHDLELARLAEAQSSVKNYHFRDDVQGDEMIFDYIIHSGPCPTTNALKIMQREGLPVQISSN